MSKMNRFSGQSRHLTNGIKSERIRVVLVLLVALILMMSAPVACNSGAKPSPQNQPPAAVTPVINEIPNGAILLDERCATCHSASKAKQARKTIDQWDQTVSRMIGKGARLTEAEKALLLNYLGKTYGP
jgi:hypothetical protein